LQKKLQKKKLLAHLGEWPARLGEQRLTKNKRGGVKSDFTTSYPKIQKPLPKDPRELHFCSQLQAFLGTFVPFFLHCFHPTQVSAISI